MESPGRRVPNYTQTTFRAVVSVGLLIWLIHRTDWGATGNALRAVSWLIIVAGFGLRICAQLIAAVRLKILLAAQRIRITYLRSARLTFQGLFASNFLPTTVGGDIVKVVALSRAGHGRGVVMASVVMDRLTNLAAVLLLLPTALTLPGMGESSPSGRPGLWVAGSALTAAILLCLTVVARRFAAASSGERLKGCPYGAEVLRIVGAARLVTGRWMANPLALSLAVLLSLSAILASVLSVWILAQGLDIAVGMVNLIAVVVLVYFVALLPVSVNGLGVLEISMAFLLVKLGVPEDRAMALVILSRLQYFATGLIGGLSMLVRPAQVQERASVDSLS